MTMRARGLERARRLFRTRRFREVLRLLEPQIFRFRTDPEYYALLGLSCLHTGEMGGAATYLGRASQLDDQNAEVLIGLAAIHLKRREPESAVACWLRVLDLDPRNPIALRGLELLRSSGGALPAELEDPAALRGYLPRVRRGFPKALVVAAALIAAAAGVGYGALRLFAGHAKAPRPGIEDVNLPSEHPEVLVAAGQSLIAMTERELLRSFGRAKRYLLDYRDNLAVHELNRILLSNATAAVKEKAQLLRSYAQAPDFATFRDPFSYDAVSRSPQEYADCHVRWRGRVANVKTGETEITFDLLVGYQDGRVLEGVVPVTVRFGVDIENGEAYEILARIRVAAVGGLTLDAVSIRPIVSRPGGSQ